MPPPHTSLLPPLIQDKVHTNEHVPCRRLEGGCDLPPKFLPGTTTHCDPHNIVSLDKEAGESMASLRHRLKVALEHALQIRQPKRRRNFAIAKARRGRKHEAMPAAYGPAIYPQSADTFKCMMQAADEWGDDVTLHVK